VGRTRKSGEGTVRLKKNGRWKGRVVIGYDDKSLPKTKNVLTKTKAECVEKLNALKNTATPTTAVKVRADMPFGDWMASAQTRGQAVKIIFVCIFCQGWTMFL